MMQIDVPKLGDTFGFENFFRTTLPFVHPVSRFGQVGGAAVLKGFRVLALITKAEISAENGRQGAGNFPDLFPIPGTATDVVVLSG